MYKALLWMNLILVWFPGYPCTNIFNQHGQQQVSAAIWNQQHLRHFYHQGKDNIRSNINNWQRTRPSILSNSPLSSSSSSSSSLLSSSSSLSKFFDDYVQGPVISGNDALLKNSKRAKVSNVGVGGNGGGRKVAEELVAIPSSVSGGVSSSSSSSLSSSSSSVLNTNNKDINSSANRNSRKSTSTSTGVAAAANAGKSTMTRQPRGSRQYDVPQIECPPVEDGMERFACPTPDRMGRYRCIDDHVLCDGFIDCPNAEDEDRMACMFYKTTKAHLDVLADALLRWARGR
ncbi:hypothetical protein CHUAL_006924 [Chamberlinius hualienensis]